MRNIRASRASINISGDAGVQRELQRLYEHVDNVEFYVGLFAEEVRAQSAVAALIGRLVGIDAFSQALTNPLLNPQVFNARSFTSSGLRLIRDTNSLADILHRNIPPGGKRYKVSLARLDIQGSVATASPAAAEPVAA